MDHKTGLRLLRLIRGDGPPAPVGFLSPIIVTMLAAEAANEPRLRYVRGWGCTSDRWVAADGEFIRLLSKVVGELVRLVNLTPAVRLSVLEAVDERCRSAEGAGA